MAPIEIRPMRKRFMATTSSPTILHMWAIWPGCTFFSAKRKRVSFCQLTLIGGKGLPLKGKP
ncbi:hypothetical protein D3C72_2278440 [compost metagenome]